MAHAKTRKARTTTSKIYVWNTGRQYTILGQRIAAMVVGNHVYFVDIDRGIDGQMVAPHAAFKVDLPQYVMNVYDTNKYTMGVQQPYRSQLGHAITSARHIPTIGSRL